MRKYLILGLLLLGFTAAFADDEFSFVAEAPESVVQGQHFKVTYSMNKEGKDFLAPDMSAFNVLMGPSQSRSQSVQIINGSVSRNTSITYTYVLSAMDAGSYTLAPAEITVKGKKYSSNSIKIEVVPEEDLSGSQQSQGSSGGGTQAQAPARSGGNVSGGGQLSEDKQIFVRQILSKTRVYEQEAILLTYKLYTRYDIRDISGVKFPDLQGFYVQEFDLDPNRQFKVENYNGYNYNTLVLKQCLLYPQHSGTIELERGSLDVILRVRNNRPSNNIFDSFFDSYSEVNKTLAIQPAKVEVRPLPAGAPASFNGAVGNFSLSGDISSTSLSANEAVTLTLKVTGNGNMRLLKNPEIKFPNDFDVYDPKVENNIKTTVNGLSGTRTIEYLAIPRFGGTFDIPSAEFSYFDLGSGQYKTIRTQPYKITVAADSGAAAASTAPAVNNYAANKEEIKNIGTDIRYIHGSGPLRQKGSFFLGSTEFWLAMGLPLAAFMIVLIVLRRRARENADIAGRRTRGANKQARRRLRSAEKHMKSGDKNGFYEETMKALWGYLSDKLSIPLANLTKENVQEEMLRHGASADLTEQFLKTLSDCEFARFSPAAGENLSMKAIYDEAIELIGRIDESLK